MTAPTIITGAIGEADLYSVASNKRDVGLGIALLDPSSAPLVLLSQTGMDARNVADAQRAKLAKAVTVDPKVEWLEDQLVPTNDAINNAAGYAAGDLTLAVDNGPYFYASCYGYLKRTGEIFKVSSVSSNNLTVTRGQLGTTAAAILNNDDIIILALANLEGATPPTARSTLKELAYNYTEIIRTVVNMTETTKNTAMLGEERDWDVQKTKAGITQDIEIEKKFLYGGRSIDRTGAETVRTMAGLATTITTNVLNAGGTLSEKTFNTDAVEPAFKRGRGSPYRILLASQRLNSVICNWGNDKIKTNVGDMKLGMMINQYVSPHGLVYIIPHPLIEGTQGIAGFLLDPAKIFYRYLQNRDTKWLPDVIKDGRDAEVAEYKSEVCIQIKNESCHALIKDVQN